MPELTLAEYQKDDLPLEELIAGRLGYVHDLFLGFDYEVVDELPADRDLVILAHNHDPKAKLARIAEHRGRVVLAIAPSDAAFDDASLPDGHSLPANIIAAFTSNSRLDDERMTNLPLGIRVENVLHFETMRRQESKARDRLLYGNFSVSSRVWSGIYGPKHIRHRLARQFTDAPWVELDISEEARTSTAELLAYYETSMRHKFALAPEGVGIDTYRHWESLYLGTIPIVRRNPTMAPFEGLPILFTDDYSEIDQKFLEQQWEHFATRRFEVERLTMSFYRRHFERAVAQLDNPRFICWGFRGTVDEAFLERLSNTERCNGPRSGNNLSVP